MNAEPSAGVRPGARHWLQDPLTYRSRPLPAWGQAGVAALAAWSLLTDLPGLLNEEAGGASLVLPLASLILLALGPLLATMRCWPGALVTLAGAVPELDRPASHALLFLSLTVLICAFTGSRRVSFGVLVLVLVWMTVNAALIPYDYLVINVVLAVAVSLLYGICRAGVRSREQLERTTAAQQQLALDHSEALLAGRRQMTRDLHDIIAHDVTVIALQADAALSGHNAVFRQQSLEAISDAAHRSLADLRAMMRVLSPGTGAEPAPADSSLSRAVADVVGNLRRLGFPTDVQVAGDLDSLPAAVQLGVLPVLRECSTNVVVHAEPGAPVRIVLDATARELALEVSNRAATGDPNPGRTPRGGFGLGFMRERVERLGGRLMTGLTDGQWRVSAVFPLAESNAESDTARVGAADGP